MQPNARKARGGRENKEEEKDDATFTTIGKSLGDVISKAKQPTFGFDKSSGVKIAGAISNPLQSTLKELSPLHKEYAEMVKVSTTFHKQGLDAAKKRLNEFNKGYTLDTDLTNDNYAVIKKPNGKAIVAFRGTDPKAKIQSGLGKGFNEPLQWIALQVGTEEMFDDHKLEPIKRKLLSKYRPDQIEQITGYSMGAVKAHRLGDMLGVDTHLYNPFLGKKFFENPKTPNTTHQIIRTTEDPASAVRVFKNKKMPKNVKVESVDPITTVKMTVKKIHSQAKTDLQAFNAADNHSLEQFTSDGDRNSLQRDLDDQIKSRVNKFQDQTRGLSANSAEYQRLQEQMHAELKPTIQLSSQENKPLTSRAKMFNSLKPSSVITALAGVAGGAGVDKLISSIESASGIPIDDHITTAVEGGLGALPQETVAKFLGGKINFARSIRSGVTGALAQEVTAEATSSLLQTLGADQASAEIVSQTLGGGVGGAVTAGGGALARQVGIRLAARAAAFTGGEFAGVAMGAELGSFVPGFGTLIGAGIGALVSLGFAIFDHESRKNAPISMEEHNYIYGLRETLAGGADIEEILNEIDDDMERDRLRTFINDSGYQASLGDIRLNRQVDERDRIRHGATNEEIARLNVFIDSEIPGWQSMTNKQRNEAFQRVATDPRNIGFIHQFSKIPVWDENASNRTVDGFGLANYGTFTTTATVIYKAQRDRARAVYINSPEYLGRQEHLSWLTELLGNDPDFVGSASTTDANRRVYELLSEMANGTGSDAQIAEDFMTNPAYAGMVPQFDDSGDMILQNHSDGILITTGSNRGVRPPAPVPSRLYQDVLTARSGSKGIVAKFINRDQEIQQMLASGDIDGINDRIRTMFAERAGQRAFGDAVTYDDPELPQFDEKGQLIYQRYSEPKPTGQVAQAAPSQHPHPAAPAPRPQRPRASEPGQSFPGNPHPGVVRGQGISRAAEPRNVGSQGWSNAP